MTRALRIGPMSPDEISGTGGGTRTDARSLIAAGDAAYPPELRAAMQRVKDHEATDALDLRALSEEFGVKVLGASVHGQPHENQVLVYLYETPSTRTARWFAPYGEQGVERTGVGQPVPLPEPWPSYDDQSVEEIRAKLDRGPPTLGPTVHAYEDAHKARKGVLDHAKG